MTIRDVHFDRFVQDKGADSRKDFIVLLKGKSTAVEKTSFDKYAGSIRTGAHHGFSDETRLMYLAREQNWQHLPICCCCFWFFSGPEKKQERTS